MDLSDQRLRDALHPRPFQFYLQIGSTNDCALAWLADGAADGSVVVADEQIQGRGRMGRAWYAPPGTALMFSYLLHPDAEEIGYVGMIGALAVCETVEALGGSAGIKWPNDVQIDGRKLCGVLPEASWQGTTLLGTVLGIGVNVRIDFTGTPFAQTAISLEDVIGALDRVDLLARLLERLDHWAARLASDELFAAWRRRLLVFGRRVSIAGANGAVQGIAEAVDRQGALLIRDDEGTLRRVIAGDLALG